MSTPMINPRPIAKKAIGRIIKRAPSCKSRFRPSVRARIKAPTEVNIIPIIINNFCANVILSKLL